ncbi:uncharacterized metal-binding protein YceD (DUF177 family) [Sphingomonas vulcanisoli]|uniref:Uncharacterized metal-binding protein YceD (DUF177 family) n=1 Tax=Sphingomonas vulcanisoli TaxID=1658060 RepID=A0ABX0TRH0_9SPHN|nr:uncharacterized metal-binding protein YceD (DUF177 family) [Sphingomonas vulcanisoli]
MTPPEFSRAYALDTLGEPRKVSIEADPAECAALAARFDLLALDRLSAEATLIRDGAVVSAEGRIVAQVIQACVASGADVPQAIDAPFALRFVPETDAPDEDVEIDSDALDDMAYTGGAIDLGEAVAQTMTLSLDPFPRAPDADAVLRAAGVLQEGDAIAPSPLAGLADLLKK